MSRKSLFDKRRVSVVNHKQYDGDWAPVTKPIVDHQRWIDDNDNRYEFVDEALAPQSDRIPPPLWGNWGQVKYHCITDDTFWRIGFIHLNRHDSMTVPDPSSCDSSHHLILIKIENSNKDEG